MTPEGYRQHRIAFENGGEAMVDLLVGADGAWSRVRSLVTNAVPVYSGTCFIEIAVPTDDARHLVRGSAIGPGTLMAVAPGQGIIAHRYADGSIAGYVALNAPETWVRSIDFTDAAAGLRIVADRFAGWAPHLTTLIATSTAEPIIRPIYALPVGLEWPCTPGVTLVGDAAHLMSPFAGEGANLAMLDGARLAAAIARYRDDIGAALAAYEAELFERSRDAATTSARNLTRFFGPDAPNSVVELFSHQLHGG